MTKQQILSIKKYFEERGMKILQICLVLDIITAQYANGRKCKYNLNNFKHLSDSL